MHSRRHTRCFVVAALLGLLADTGAAAQQAGAARPPLPFDSSTVRSLLADAFASALEAPPGERGALVTAVGRLQVQARDFARAERTVTHVENAAPSDDARAFGVHPTVAFFDRAGLLTRLVCGLRDAKRSDDAVAVVRRMPAGAAREWELAHIASLTARSPLSATDSAARRRGETPEAWRAALALAREVVLPEARLDALLSVASEASDSTTREDVARAAYADARRIRLASSDRQSSRNAMLASLALDLRRSDDVRSLFAALIDADDLNDVVIRVATSSSDTRLLRELAPRAIAAGLAIHDSAARLAFLSPLRASLVRAAGIATADTLLPARFVETPRAGGRAARDSAIMTSMDPRDVAQRALDHRDFAGVRRAVERLPVVDESAKRASLWSDLAWSEYISSRDTARAYLALAHEALVHSHADSATLDGVAARIADRQFWIADHDGGVATLNLVRDPNAAAWPVRDWGASTLAGLTADRLRAYADQIRDPRVRDAVLLRVITGYLAIRGATDAQATRARDLADSIATPALHLRARVAVTDLMLQRRDTVNARAMLTTLLSYPGLMEDEESRVIISRLAVNGGASELQAWAHAAAPGLRARRLIAVAEAFQRGIDARAGNLWVRLSNGPDACLDVF